MQLPVALGRNLELDTGAVLFGTLDVTLGNRPKVRHRASMAASGTPFA
jgi:hypothetical protein